MPRAYPARHGLARSSPTLGLAAGLPVGRTSLSHRQSSDDDGVSTDTPISDKPLGRRRGSRSQKKKDGFSSKIQIPKLGGKKGHPHDVANTFR